MGTLTTIILLALGIAGVIAVLYVLDVGIEKVVRIFVPAREDMAPYKTPSYTQQPNPFSYY
ncbi:hypothetical protein [Corynebacterium lubricantis]|uniref:hypothetical protein n=1 Tax=Corynebacterium lubricantis TaxID=541095 RepID=UPI00035DA2A1|nr:hypothetical protein [Corynebacterium lubricantis]